MIDWLRTQRDDDSHRTCLTDAELAARAKVDRTAFGCLFDRHAEEVYRYCYRRIGDRAAAEDATSAIFMQALSNLARYEERAGSGFAAWLFTIAHNVASDAARRTRRHGSLDVLAEEADWVPSIEDDAIAADEARSLRALLLRLPADQRWAIELRLAGLTGPEIAEALGRTHGAVKMLQFRAMQGLRTLLGVADPRRKDDQ